MDESNSKKTGAAMDRRAFLKAAAAVGALSALDPAGSPVAEAARSRARTTAAPGDCGVASGDPRPDRVVLWTRVPDAYHVDGVLDVAWEVASSAGFEAGTIVSTGLARTSADADFTVAVTAAGLQPFTWYYYRFQTTHGFRSVVGRTLTAPAAGTTPSALRFAFVSCQVWSAGWYNVHNAMARDDLHFIVSLGDNVYEGGYTGIRTDDIGEVTPNRAITLKDWRDKYKLYLSDPDLQEARRLFPWIVTWDDHEVFENYAGGSDMSADERAIQAAGYQAYREFMPLDTGIALAIEGGIPHLPIHRSFAFGDLLEVFALDGRQYRDGLVCEKAYATFGCDALYDPSRTMLELDQREWLYDGLSSSTARWKDLANNVVMMAFKVSNAWASTLDRGDATLETYDGFLVNLDQWDGYPAERQALLEHVRDEGIRNLVVVTGDVHNCWAGVLRPDFTKPRTSAVGVELVGGSVTSNGLVETTGYDLTRPITAAMKPANPHIDWMDAKYHVYTKLEVTPEATYATYVAVDTITEPAYGTFPLKRYTIFDGEAELIPGTAKAGRGTARAGRTSKRPAR